PAGAADELPQHAAAPDPILRTADDEERPGRDGGDGASGHGPERTTFGVEHGRARHSAGMMAG
ncbi:MAG: hypothetical protein QOJ49_113, partial [Actinomycetota bacterium]|nr:hypothetical protein [Actinomycetota bacterium]